MLRLKTNIGVLWRIIGMLWSQSSEAEPNWILKLMSILTKSYLVIFAEENRTASQGGGEEGWEEGEGRLLHHGGADDWGQHAQHSGGHHQSEHSALFYLAYALVSSISPNLFHTLIEIQGADGSLQAPERRRRTRASQQVKPFEDGWTLSCAIKIFRMVQVATLARVR